MTNLRFNSRQSSNLIFMIIYKYNQWLIFTILHIYLKTLIVRKYTNYNYILVLNQIKILDKKKSIHKLYKFLNLVWIQSLLTHNLIFGVQWTIQRYHWKVVNNSFLMIHYQWEVSNGSFRLLIWLQINWVIGSKFWTRVKFQN